MIARISGTIVERGEDRLLIQTQGLTYEVWMPAASMQRLDEGVAPDGRVDLVTYHYHQVEPSRSIPVLIGFLNEIEKEFFEAFITVSGIGPRAAVRALNQPISLIARAIDAGDLGFLRTLPGIGQQRAKEIVAKLQNKIGRFGLIRDRKTAQPQEKKDFEEDALTVLLQLGYKRNEAQQMMQQAIAANPSIAGTEQLLNEVYKQRKAH